MDEPRDEIQKKTLRCFKELREIVQETRQSFDIWKRFACEGEYLCKDAMYHLTLYNPLFFRTKNAHLQSVFVNLFILGDSDKQSVNCSLLVKLLTEEGNYDSAGFKQLKRRMERYLRYATSKHCKVARFRHKYYAHRDKNKSMDDLVMLFKMTIEEVNDTITAYYRFMECAAVILGEAISSEEEVIKDMECAMNDAKPFFGQLPSLQNQ
ncbi:MAG: hypothetical protein IAE94_09540 [Chthoniobacterales bacterium]|nr:hypothetical protein [Chthoniobacterales bacterium]